MKEKHRQCIDWMLSLSKEERNRYADKRLWNIQEEMRKMGYSCAKIHETILGIFRFFVSADLDCRKGEFDLFKEITGCKYNEDQFFKMTNHGRTKECMDVMANWMHSLSDQMFTDVFTLGAYIMTADGKFHEDEEKTVNFIEQYRP